MRTVKFFLGLTVIMAITASCSRGKTWVPMTGATQGPGNSPVINVSCFEDASPTVSVIPGTPATVNQEVVWQLRLPENCHGSFEIFRAADEVPLVLRTSDSQSIFFSKTYPNEGPQSESVRVVVVDKAVAGKKEVTVSGTVTIQAPNSTLSCSVSVPNATIQVPVDPSNKILQVPQLMFLVQPNRSARVTALTAAPNPAALSMLSSLPTTASLNHSVTASLSNLGPNAVVFTVSDAVNPTQIANCHVMLELVPITATPPPDALITVNDQMGTVMVDGSVPTIRLAWTSSYASSCTVAPVGLAGTLGLQNVDRADVTTTYTLTCVGPGGSVTRTVTTQVNCATNVLATVNDLRTRANQMPLKDCPAGVNVFDSRCTMFDNLNKDGGGANQSAAKISDLVPGTQIVLSNLTGNVITRIYQNRVESYKVCSQAQLLMVQFTDNNNVRVDPAGYPHGLVPFLSLLGTGFTVPPNATRAWVGYIDGSYWDAYPTRTASSYPSGGPECIYTFTNIGCQ